MNIESFDYRELPGQNPLFLAYVHEFERISELYKLYPRSPEEWKARVERVQETAVKFPRDILIPELTEFNQSVGASTKTFQNLELLATTDSVAVLTGQQVGLFGGPCYSVYKAATAIRISQFLERLGYKSVPVFWMATDDSDFQEVRSTVWIDNVGELAKIEFPDERSTQEQMAGTVALRSVIDRLEELRSYTRTTSSGERISDLLSRAYRPEYNFREAFARWLTEVFEDYGLIVFDPLLPNYRRHLSEFYQIALERREDLITSSFDRKRQLEKLGFSAQVWLEESETFLFLVEGQHRYKLEFHGDRIKVKNREDLEFSVEELLRALGQGELRLSPNVLLRPVLQDYLFPTVASVAGPSEIAYYSQVNAISKFWDREMAIVPRAAFTLVDRKSQRLVRKYRLEVSRVLSAPRLELTEKILREGPQGAIIGRFHALRLELGNQLSELERAISEEDPPVAEMLRKASSKIAYQIDKVNRRFVANQQERQDHLKNHLNHLKSHLLPNDHLQERILNFNYFLSEEGPDLIKRIVEGVEPFSVSHRFMYL
jgi:bacillithiol biosynthesis cysteine-adding enzyme BshC